MITTAWWASEDFWRKATIWITAIMVVVLIVLTYDSLSQITAGTERVPAYSVINNRVYYRQDKSRNMPVPVIGDSAPLFGKMLSETEAEALVQKGKITTQAKNCMGCHTILGNGAYYAPDLTKAWLDPAWGSEGSREELMLRFLLDPPANSRGYGSKRRMPNLGITEEEAHGIIAFLKWMSTIDTNGFPRNFTPMKQEDDR
ncbi:MAG: cytochrome c [Proteobacteria bacterium]|nr:MAG: cytochrome c [Pseudomonadota bacterium]